jgi:hypothetical protein
MEEMKKKFKLSSLFLVALAFIPLVINTIVYPQFFSQRFSIPELPAVLAPLALLFLLKLKYKLNFTGIFWTSFAFYWLGTGLYYLMFFLETTKYKNYVFANFHLVPSSFIWIPIFSALVSLVALPKKTLQKKAKLLIFSLAPAIILSLLSIRLTQQNLSEFIIQEDGPVEYSTVLASLAISLFGGLILSKIKARKTNSQYKNFLVVAFCLVAVVFGIFIAGEEISWGQRIFNIQTPEKLKEINNQDETTIHNIEQNTDIFRYFTLFAGVHGAISWLIIHGLKKTQLIPKKIINSFQLWVPPSYTVTWFVLTPYIFFYGYGGLTRFSENVELLLMSGYAITWGRNFFKLK